MQSSASEPPIYRRRLVAIALRGVKYLTLLETVTRLLQDGAAPFATLEASGFIIALDSARRRVPAAPLCPALDAVVRDGRGNCAMAKTRSAWRSNSSYGGGTGSRRSSIRCKGWAGPTNRRTGALPTDCTALTDFDLAQCRRRRSAQCMHGPNVAWRAERPWPNSLSFRGSGLGRSFF